MINNLTNHLHDNKVKFIKKTLPNCVNKQTSFYFIL